MNCKELLEQADQRIAEAENIKLAKQNIKDLEELIKVAQDDTYDLKYCGKNDMVLENKLDVDNYDDFRKLVQNTFQRYLSVQTIRLEQILGITPKMVNPDFEAVVRDVEESARINNKSDISTYVEIPEQSNKRLSMKKLTDDDFADVRRMYVDENMTAAQIADYYQTDHKHVSNYINRRGLRRRSYARTKKTKLAPAETERPS